MVNGEASKEFSFTLIAAGGFGDQPTTTSLGATVRIQAN